MADRLLADGHRVRVLDNLDLQVHPSRTRPAYLDREVELRIGDVRDRTAVARALGGIDSVVHFAAAVGVGQSMYEIERYTSINALGCAVLLEEVVERRDRVRKIVVASSMSVYGEGQYTNRFTGERGLAPGPRGEAQLARREWEIRAGDGEYLVPEPTAETKPLRPISIYAIGKRDHEEMVLSIGAAYGIPAVALRFFNVFGARQSLSNPYTGVAAIFASLLLSQRSPVVFENGMQTRDFIDVRDVARACCLALTTTPADGHAVNIGTGSPTSVLDAAEVIAQHLGVRTEPQVTGRFRAGDVRHCYADTRLADTLLGFRAQITFEEGMCGFIGWLAEQEADASVDHAMEALAARGLNRSMPGR